MAQGILLTAENEIDFMIHGVFKYNFFGNEVWITTTHMCMLIVLSPNHSHQRTSSLMKDES